MLTALGAEEAGRGAGACGRESIQVEGDRPVGIRRELSECGEEDHVMPADSRESSLGGSGHTELHTPGEAPCQELAFCYEKTEVCKMMCDLRKCSCPGHVLRPCGARSLWGQAR